MDDDGGGTSKGPGGSPGPWAWAKAVLLLPGNALVVFPGAVLWFSRETTWGGSVPDPESWLTWAAVPLVLLGTWQAMTTMRLFLRKGEGTPAPWDPPRKLVVAGPYRRVRNPMLSSVFFLLAAEALLTTSWAVAAWGVVFVLGNLVYMPFVEEPGLRKRFGEDYE
ncbi:MAG: methyltransferase family protein, partial [Planctomycetota bacterium]